MGWLVNQYLRRSGVYTSAREYGGGAPAAGSPLPASYQAPFSYLTLYCLIVSENCGPKRRTQHIFYSVQKIAVVQRKKKLSWPFRTAFPIQNLWLAFSLQKLPCDFPDVSLVYEDGKYLQRRTRSSWRRRVLRKWAILHLYWEERLRRYEFHRSGVLPI